MIAYDFNAKSVICKGSLEECAAAMLAAEKSDPENASIEVGHMDGDQFKSLTVRELLQLRKILIAR